MQKLKMVRTKEPLPFWRDTSRQFDAAKFELSLDGVAGLIEIVRDGIAALVPVANVDYMMLDTDLERVNTKTKAPVAAQPQEPAKPDQNPQTPSPKKPKPVSKKPTV